MVPNVWWVIQIFKMLLVGIIHKTYYNTTISEKIRTSMLLI